MRGTLAIGAALLLRLAGCRDPSSHAPAPSASTPSVGVKEPDANDRDLPGTSGATTGRPGTITGPLRCEDYSGEEPRSFECAYCERQPDEVSDCPGPDACVYASSWAVLSKNGWRHVWPFFYTPGRPCVKDGIAARELPKVLALEGLSEVDVSCRLMGWAPSLFGADLEWKEVAVTPEPGHPRPSATSPTGAQRELYLTRVRVLSKDEADWHERPRKQLFSEEERASMTASTFLQPTLRVVESERWKGDPTRRVRFFVLYSPESSKVYTFDASYTVSEADLDANTVGPRDIIDFERDKAAPLGRWLRSLGVESVRFPVNAACWIPDDLGGKRWYHLSFGRGM